MVKFKSVHSYNHFAQKMIHSNRYFYDVEEEEFLKAIVETSFSREETLKKNDLLWRAQIGHGWETLYDGDKAIADTPCPYPPDRLKPKKDKAQEGRANPKGIPCLYCSNRKETALSEVRPWLGSLISLGLFSVQRDLKIINFATQQQKHLIYLKEPGPQEREKAIWADIDRAFSTPVNPNNDITGYVPTQIIAGLFMKKGFDGIAYRSAFGTGYNFALFDIESAQLMNCSLYKVEDISFDFSQSSKTYEIFKQN